MKRASQWLDALPLLAMILGALVAFALLYTTRSH
jgi:hypothetical protein